ncbi:alginate export family protein [Bowmanella dokdonensis]|uniref:Alginate export family protein n=1 Tax=Bowmanella dokdonensis TaxID=751969 RepID=A0A939DKF0_9ALTE|nr:alginate export family protein [Bowmanella dokdonensis]MBN7824358.1 alginate export family protein [Bowmanella dokdonensis]
MQRSPLTLAMLAAFTFSPLQAADSLSDAIGSGKAAVDFRYRLEMVDQDGLDEQAWANTLRSRFNYQSAPYRHLTATLELDNVSSLGAERYNSTVNGNTDRPVVADPTGTELNQAYLSYKQDNLSLHLGRQRINLDDQRFVGGVGWRQNEQTYDGYRISYQASDRVGLDYSYLFNVNRIFGEDSAGSDLHGNIHLLNASGQIADGHKLTAFGYWMDFDNAATLSNQTQGLRYQGQVGVVSITASLAWQQEYGDNPRDYQASYSLVEIGGKHSSVRWKLGQEVLGADENGSFITPLATLHKFQGFADKFLSTPAQGIQDRYLGLGTDLAGVKVDLTYHSFDSDRQNLDYGSEWDLSAGYALTSKLGLLVKGAWYEAEELATDTSKIWLMLSLKI